VLLDPLDMVQCELLDKLSILTYLAQLYKVLSNHERVFTPPILDNSSNTAACEDIEQVHSVHLQVENLTGQKQNNCVPQVAVDHEYENDVIVNAKVATTEEFTLDNQVTEVKNDHDETEAILSDVHIDIEHISTSYVEPDTMVYSEDEGNPFEDAKNDKDEPIKYTCHGSGLSEEKDEGSCDEPFGNGEKCAMLLPLNTMVYSEDDRNPFEDAENDNDEPIEYTCNETGMSEEKDKGSCDEPCDNVEKRAMLLPSFVNYPEDKNPFGYCDDVVPENVNQGCDITRSLSLNPFGSDLDSEEDENPVDGIPTSVSLNPFGSDFDSEEDVQSPGVCLPTSPLTGTVSPSPVLRPIRPAPPPPVPLGGTKNLGHTRISSQISAQTLSPMNVAEKGVNGGGGEEWKKDESAIFLAHTFASEKMTKETILQELFDIDVKQEGLERQRVKVEKFLKEKSSDAKGESGGNPYAEHLIIQLCDLVSEKNELAKRKSELLLLHKEYKLEERQSECETQIRELMSKPEHQNSDKEAEERLIEELLEIVAERNKIVECLDFERLKGEELEDGYNTEYALSEPIRNLNKVSGRNMNIGINIKDVESAVCTSRSKREKPRRKSTSKKLIGFATKKLTPPKE